MLWVLGQVYNLTLDAETNACAPRQDGDLALQHGEPEGRVIHRGGLELQQRVFGVEPSVDGVLELGVVVASDREFLGFVVAPIG